jgi:hypothetical protein
MARKPSRGGGKKMNTKLINPVAIEAIDDGSAMDMNLEIAQIML